MTEARFYLDESVATAAAIGARRRGVSVTTARDEGMLRAPDELQLQFAAEHGYVLVTHDRGFEQRHWNGEKHSGLLFIPATASVGRVVEWITLAHTLITAEEFVARFESCR